MSKQQKTKMIQEIIRGIDEGKVLSLKYHGFTRFVEAHALGTSNSGNLVLRCWQISGDTLSESPVGWKLLMLYNVESVRVTQENSEAPRPGFKSGDRGMREIVHEVSTNLDALKRKV